MTKPISPSEVGKLKKSRFPDEVFAAFNEVIAKHWNGREAEFTQDEVVAAILARLPDVSRETLFENRWLDVEGSYKSAGWSVEYDKPGYNETYPATFTFKRRSR